MYEPQQTAHFCWDANDAKFTTGLHLLDDPHAAGFSALKGTVIAGGQRLERFTHVQMRLHLTWKGIAFCIRSAVRLLMRTRETLGFFCLQKFCFLLSYPWFRESWHFEVDCQNQKFPKKNPQYCFRWDFSGIPFLGFSHPLSHFSILFCTMQTFVMLLAKCRIEVDLFSMLLVQTECVRNQEVILQSLRVTAFLSLMRIVGVRVTGSSYAQILKVLRYRSAYGQNRLHSAGLKFLFRSSVGVLQAPNTALTPKDWPSTT